MAKLLIVEDEVKIRLELKLLLERHGHMAVICTDFDQVVSEIDKESIELVLLDINLITRDGHQICKEIRQVSQVPVVMVTSQDSEMDELMSITLGADDFITKPFNTRILLARVNAVLRRSQSLGSNAILKHKGVELDLARGQVSFEGQVCDLTKNEIKILNILYENKDAIVKRTEIIESLWESDMFVDDNTLTVNINRLRKKLADIGVDDFLITKRGMGYRI